MPRNTSILDDLKWQFRYGNIVNRLIIINLAVYLLFLIVWIFFKFSEQSLAYDLFMSWLYMPAAPLKFLTRPWTLITYQFLHGGFLHILFNMLWLYWMGRILVDYLSERRILALYLMGGIAGGLLYMLVFNIFPLFGENLSEYQLLGASASVYAIVFATVTLLPDYEIRLVFLGDVKLKYLTLAVIIMDIILIASGKNVGGHIAHLGGAFFGWLFIAQLQKGNDWSTPLAWIQDKFSKKEKPLADMKVVHRSSRKSKTGNKDTFTDQASIDAILDKLLENGNNINALTKKERDILNRASKDS